MLYQEKEKEAGKGTPSDLSRINELTTAIKIEIVEAERG